MIRGYSASWGIVDIIEDSFSCMPWLQNLCTLCWSILNGLMNVRKLSTSSRMLSFLLQFCNWNKVFHVHIDASNFAIGCILAQPRENNMDFPISYASYQLKLAEKNYTTTKMKGLTMVYVVKKFQHYLLANKFVFVVDQLLTIMPFSTLLTSHVALV